jgi:hypothetical protein
VDEINHNIDIPTMFGYANEAQTNADAQEAKAKECMNNALEYALDSGDWLIEIDRREPGNYMRNMRRYWQHGESTAGRNKYLALRREQINQLIDEYRKEDPTFVCSIRTAVKKLKELEEEQRNAGRSRSGSAFPVDEKGLPLTLHILEDQIFRYYRGGLSRAHRELMKTKFKRMAEEFLDHEVIEGITPKSVRRL